MTVFVLLREDSYDRTEILGVYATARAVARAAEAKEPDREFTWDLLDGTTCAFDNSLLGGPIYTYVIERHEVTP